VKLDRSAQPAPQPDPQNAVVYFIHDAGNLGHVPLGYPTVRIAMDGAWIGATRGDSWFSVSAPPGAHRLCAALQTSLYSPLPELAHVTVERGKIYYFRTRLLDFGQFDMLELNPVDSDQGQYLVDSYPKSVLKK
jgi:hypothetical protein